MERVLPLHALEQGHAQVLGVLPGALLIYDRACDGHMLQWDDEQAARQLLRDMDRPRWLVLEGTALDEEADRLFDLRSSMLCLSCVYPSRAPLPSHPLVGLKPMRAADVPLVARHYDILSVEMIAEAVAEGRLFGGWYQEEMVGFIGLHEEGSLGMLHVFEHWRGQGLATAIESLMINRLLDQGQRVFGQIVVGNQPSIALQRSLGFVIADQPGSWRWA